MRHGARRLAPASAGFTLVEMVTVMVVSAIIAAGVAVFIAGPVRAYYATVNRALLVDTADTALRRFDRDLGSALPNSVRLTQVAGLTYIEFLPIVSAGHYRSAPDPLSGRPTLDFTSSSGNSFEIIGPYDTPTVGQQLVIFNLGPGVNASDAYAGSNRRSITGYSTSTNSISYALTGGQFPFASPADRYFIVNTASTYVCDPVGGTLARYTGYAIQASQPTSTLAAPLTTATKGVLANGVSACDATLTRLYQRRALVTLDLTLTAGGDSISYYQETHIASVP